MQGFIGQVVGITRCAVVACLVFGTSAFADQRILYNYNGYPQWTHIDEPVVNASQTILPIQVWPNDRIWIKAYGCAQTGGSGLTWKRYINPSGPNSGTLYHGKILVPGVQAGLTNLSDILHYGDGYWSDMMTVPYVPTPPGVPPPPPQSIVIGYSDDNYGDNGYWGHDNGTENQCNGVWNAWLELYICRADPSHGATC